MYEINWQMSTWICVDSKRKNEKKKKKKKKHVHKETNLTVKKVLFFKG
jgi:hypothetical protein